MFATFITHHKLICHVRGTSNINGNIGDLVLFQALSKIVICRSYVQLFKFVIVLFVFVVKTPVKKLP